MSGLTGTWESDEVHGLESIVDHFGVDCEMRKLLLTANPTYTYTPLGDDGMKIRVDSEIRNAEVSFKFGEEIDEKTVLGRVCKSMYRKISNNEIVNTQRHPEGIIEIDHKVDGNKLVMTVCVADKKCCRTFHRKQ
uniref:Lipocalin/cytosolic fatty-acid binding domain-containing protein n=1 Tax=Trichobilharzia regenti TaxID=157069 RepID=A0AA85J1W1_TRIRE|nr:unnamed protein product [Trichobilharzia regenti]